MSFTKAPTLEKAPIRDVINHFLEKYEALCNSQHVPTTSDLEKYISQKIRLSNNGQIVCNTLAEYIDRITKFKKKNSHIEITRLMDEPICCNDQAVINYEVTLTPRTGKPVEIALIAIATVKDNKITDWIQVAHEKGSTHWDS